MIAPSPVPTVSTETSGVNSEPLKISCIRIDNFMVPYDTLYGLNLALGRQNDGRYSIAPVEQASHPPISAPEAEEG